MSWSGGTVTYTAATISYSASTITYTDSYTGTTENPTYYREPRNRVRIGRGYRCSKYKDDMITSVVKKHKFHVRKRHFSI